MLNLQFAPFPVIETERILLRKVRMRDAEVLFTLRSDADAMKYIPRELPKTVEDSKKMIKKIFNMEEKQ
jgi:ribosomal-protein-alanine N-acetyltransferase